MSDLEPVSHLHGFDAFASELSNQEQRSGSARQSSDANSPSPRDRKRYTDANDGEDDGEDTDAGNRHGNGRARRPHLQGRFSGRLETKQDEKILAEECKLLGPLLGGCGKRGEKCRLTLAKIVRGIASGDVRKHCELRESRIKELEAAVSLLRSGGDISKFMGDEASAALGPALVATQAQPAPHHEPNGIELATPLRSPSAQVQQRSLNMSQLHAQQSNDPDALSSVSRTLKAQAHNFQAHAHRLVEQSKGYQHIPQAAAQIEIQAQSFHTKAQSLEMAAQAQNLQAKAVAHAHAQAEAQAKANVCASQAENHGAAVQSMASQLKNLHGVEDSYVAPNVTLHAQQIEHEAKAHVKAQQDCTVQAQNHVYEAQVHAEAQNTAQQQAQQAAIEAHHLDAQAKELQEKAHSMKPLIPQAVATQLPGAPTQMPAISPHPLHQDEGALPVSVQVQQLPIAETSTHGAVKAGTGLADPRQFYAYAPQ